jgi:hypothetical protein
MVAVVGSIRDQLQDLVSALALSEQWRERLALVELLRSLGKMSESDVVHAQFGQLCMRFLEDEASPVRKAAAEQLTSLGYVQMTGNEIPAAVVELLGSNSYRRRQSALLILESLIEKAEKEDERSILVGVVKKMCEDPCQNVIAFANAVLENVKG